MLKIKVSEGNYSQPEFDFRSKRPLKNLLRIYKGQNLKLVASIILFAIKHSPVWILPVIIAQMINIITDTAKYPIHDLWTVGIIFFAIIIQNIPTHTLYVRVFSGALNTMQMNLRSAIVRRLQELSISFHDNFQSGRLQTKVLRDVETLEILSRNIMNSVMPAILTIIVAFSVTILRQPLVAVFYLVSIPISSSLVFVFSKRMTARNKEYRSEIESLSANVVEMIQMIPVTRAHGVEEAEVTKIRSRLERLKTRGIRLEVVGALFGASSWTSFQVIMLICLMFTSILAYRKMISIGDVVLFQSYFAMIVGAVNLILNSYPDLARGFESIRSIAEILESPDIEHNEGKRKVDSVNGYFVFDHVSYTYPIDPFSPDNKAQRPAVSDIDLYVQPGESVAFVGESGSGKSTLMNLVIGFRRPTQGRILLDGIDMQALDLRTYRRFLAVVPQTTLLFSGTVRENILYGLDKIDDKRLWEILEMANAAEFVSKLPHTLDTTLGELGTRLSGGQRQRIAIARAIIRNPKVIVLDEATSSLDVASESQIQEALLRLVTGRTTFIVAHRLSTIRNADRIMVMKNGSVVESGTHEDLMNSKGEFYRFKLLQQ
ncbi:MAG TPA: ABC transporter ATP-binding protein [Candidatus Acidoferrales bacterium]|nr:ABC transporter ATP-binding protein [Candidatus Acidoferrales bacterium]